MFRIPRAALWKELRRIRDHYEQQHPLMEEALAVGIAAADDPERARRAHARLIEALGGSRQALPQLTLCERDDEWLVIAPDDGMFVSAWASENWALTPAIGPAALFAPARPQPDGALRSWVAAQLREGRCLHYPLLDPVRARREADYMLDIATGDDTEASAPTDAPESVALGV